MKLDTSGLESFAPLLGGAFNDLSLDLSAPRSFDLPVCSDFDGFQKDATKMLKHAKGTTTLGFIFKEGVIIAADSRASMGGYICFRVFIPSSLRPLSSVAADGGEANNYYHLIKTLCKQDNLKQAIHLLPHEPSPTQRTFESLIFACTHRHSPTHAPLIHRRLTDSGFDQDPFLAAKLIEMYSHFNALDGARKVFDQIIDKTIFLCNALLRALAQADQGEEAISVFRDMVGVGITVDNFTYSYMLKACLVSSSHHSPACLRVR